MNTLKKSILITGAALAAAGVMTMSAAVKDGVVGETSVRPAMHPFGDHRIFMQGPTEMMKTFESGNVYLRKGQSPHPPHRTATVPTRARVAASTSYGVSPSMSTSPGS